MLPSQTFRQFLRVCIEVPWQLSGETLSALEQRLADHAVSLARELPREDDEPSREWRMRRRLSAARGTLCDVPFKEAKRQLVAPFEREYIQDLHRIYGDNLSAASRVSQLTRRHLRTLYKKYGLR